MENKHNNSNKSVHVLFLIDLVTWHKLRLKNLLRDQYDKIIFVVASVTLSRLQ